MFFDIFFYSWEPAAEAKASEGNRASSPSTRTHEMRSTRNSISVSVDTAARRATPEVTPLPPHEAHLVARIVKVLKALTRHASTTNELIRSNQLQTLFQMVQVGGQGGGVAQRSSGNASWRSSAGPLQRATVVPARQLVRFRSFLCLLLRVQQVRFIMCVVHNERCV